jgi:peptidoglycan/LPS O-acetylase OafA/YrhL
MMGPIIPMTSLLPLALGVSFFFVLSGFILTYAYQDGFKAGEFYLARFARLWPVHAVTLALAFWLLSPFLIARPEWALPFLANALLLQAWVPVVGYVFSFNAVSWSISVELFFYLIFPFLLGAAYRKILLLIIAVTAAGIAAMELTGAPVGRLPIWHFSPGHFIVQNPVMRVLEFAVGVGFGRLFLTTRIHTGTRLEVLAVAAVLLFGTLAGRGNAVLTSIGLPHAGFWFSQSGGMLIFAAAIYVFAHEEGVLSRVLRWRGLVLLGEISFCTYMLHQIVQKYAVAQRWPETHGAALTTLYALLLTYGGSYLLWRLVEKPCRAWILSFAEAPSERRAAKDHTNSLDG